MIENVLSVPLEAVLDETAKMKIAGYKFVTLSCVELDTDTVYILYHFDCDYRLAHLRLTASKDARVPSISHIYPSAFLAENEIQDLFNIAFTNLPIDFKHTLFLDKRIKKEPLCRYTMTDKSAPSAGDGVLAQKPNG